MKATMKKEILAEWLKRLRSGEYKPGVGYLRTESAQHGARYCCLGVLCEIAVEQGAIEASPPEPVKLATGWNRLTYYDGDTAGLTGNVMHWAGIEGMTGLGGLHDGKQPLSRLNDEGHPFEFIADQIEARVVGI